ncbi:hypothetical protein [Neoroseomonas soli]|uniref:Uncharacterized protein n=1 Tax=Neoroseomonas soli TaxID=1081025 RepID=A0A9X9WXF6_9PROT|nr:hypothetical protein [Neoroseomonas soli]MBR0671835.1 hypothetical protein [Neoroseomonas soli]
MSSQLVAALHHEERAIVAELRASKPFQRLEGIRRLLEMYDTQPSVMVGLEISPAMEPERAAAPVIHIAPAAAAAAVASPSSVPPTIAQAIAMPGPVAVMAEATVAESAHAAPVGAGMPGESASVVSSVRAALLGIGKA